MQLPASDDYMTFSPVLNYLLGLSDSVYTQQPFTLVSRHVLNDTIDTTRNTLSLIWVYADFVESTLMGPICDTLLTMIVVSENKGVADHLALNHIGQCQ